MKFSLVVLALAMLAAPAVPRPARAAPHLRWDACYGESAARVDKTFACDTNVGFDALILSLTCSEHLENVLGFEGTLEVVPGGSSLPSWWNFLSVARQPAIVFDREQDAAWTRCNDFFGGGTSVFVGGMAPTASSPNRARLRFAAAVPNFAPVAVGPEMGELYLLRLRLLHRGAGGAGAGVDCPSPAGLVLQDVRIDRPLGVGDWDDVAGTGLDTDYWVTWQGGSPPDGVNPASSKSRTWGQVKALYR